MPDPLPKGADVVLSDGRHGVVVRDHTHLLEVRIGAEGTIRISRGQIAEVRSGETDGPAEPGLR